MAYRYYTLYRPPMPGTIPRQGLEGIKSFDDRTEVEPGIRAWGYAELVRIRMKFEVGKSYAVFFCL